MIENNPAATLTTYRVIYEIDIEAESPVKAATDACELIKDPDGLSPIFTVIPWVTGEDGLPKPPKYDSSYLETAPSVDMNDVWSLAENKSS